MGEQALDLRSTVLVLRRRRLVLAAAALLGAASGVGLSLLSPPTYTTSSQVLLPQMQQVNGQVIGRDVATEVSVAKSDVVLGAAGRELGLSAPLRILGRAVDVEATSDDVLEITARGDSPGEAQALARAVAEAEVAYVHQAASSLTNAEMAALEDREQDLQDNLDTVSSEIDATRARAERENPASISGKADAAALAQLTAEQANLVLRLDEVQSQMVGNDAGRSASIIEPAATGRRPGALRESGTAGLMGLVLAVVLAGYAVLLAARRDRRLRFRDEIADAVGSPVVGSWRSRQPRTAAGWISLLIDYEPGKVDAWALRQSLRQLRILERPDALDSDRVSVPHPRSVTLIALAGDPRGCAVGAQLAAYAADAGVQTRLTALARHESAASLWAAFGAASGTGEVRSGLWVDAGQKPDVEASLTVALVIVDHLTTELAGLPDSSVNVLAVAAGVATAEDLAKVAVLADDAGHRIDAVLVSDPDDLDRTTGRLLQRERSQQVPLPGRMTGTSPASHGTVSALPQRRP